MKAKVREKVANILEGYDPKSPNDTAQKLRSFWLEFDPISVASIKAEQRSQQETVGIPVSVLKQIGMEMGKIARNRTHDFVPLARVLWDECGREGRVTAAVLLQDMELVDPTTIIPFLMELCCTCITWEDSDWLAGALEPILRKEPEQWLGALGPWLSDENKWVRRSCAIALGRLPMKHSDHTSHSLEMIERLLFDKELDVKRAVSFAIRLSARGEIEPVRDLLARHVPPKNPAATWVLCDVMRKMTKSYLPQFTSLLPRYEEWASDANLSTKERRSVESAIKALRMTGKGQNFDQPVE